MLNNVTMPKRDSTIRVIELIKEKGISPKEISKSTGIKYNTITNAMGDNNRNFTIEQISEICEAFDFNQTYCVFGRGDKYGYKASDKIEIKDDLNFNDIKEIAKEISDKDCEISFLKFQNDMKTIEKSEYITYLLPMSAMGGSLTGFAANGVTLQNCEAVISPIADVDFAITVYGESMAPEYPSGSRILIKKINPSIFIDWGKTYVLDTPNGVIVKEIHECKGKEGYITCHSVNPDPKFSDFDVPMSEIYGMYRVLMCLSAK